MSFQFSLLKKITIYAVALSFVSVYSCKQEVKKDNPVENKSKYSNIDKPDNGDTATVGEFPAQYKIVYINTDTLWEHYEFVKDSKKKLEAMEKQMRSRYEEKYNAAQADYEKYYSDIQKGRITSKDAAAQREASLKKQQDEIVALDNQLSNQLMTKQEELNNRVKDTIQAFLHRFRVEKGYTMIIQYGYLSALLSGDEKLDVTEAATKGLNREYTTMKPKLKF